MLLLAGIAHSTTMILILRTMPVEGWTGIRVNMALARAGDAKSNTAFLKEFREASLRERMLRISQVSYVRTPEAVALLRDYLSSREETPTEGDMIGQKLSHMALMELRKVVKGLPPGERGSPYSVTEKDVGDAIQWLKDHPNPEIMR